MEITNFKIEKLQQEITRLEHELDKTREEFSQYKAEQAKKENNRLIAGIMFLGSLVLTLGGYIWMKVTAGGI